MTGAEKILKSMAMAGVEWELKNEQLAMGNGQCADEPSPAEPRGGDARDWQSPESSGGPPPKNAARFSPPPQGGNFTAPQSRAPISNSDITDIAKKLAAEPDIIGAIKKFTQHPLYSAARNIVPPAFQAPGPALLAITDIPSHGDDAEGRILTGAEGELFDKMMAAIGLARTQIAVSPLVFWRPAGGRTPTADEVSFCRPFLNRIIADLRPGKILTLGALAAREIAGAALPRDHGKICDAEIAGIWRGSVIPIYKPEFILQNPSVKKDVWEAIKKLK
jgi:DNA polymerase